MDCHIEVFNSGKWIEAAEVRFSDIVRRGFRADGCVFEYDFDYAFGTGLLPVSLKFPVDAALHQLTSWPSFLYDLVPQGNGRKFLLERLKIADGQSSDVPLLCAGAFNPVGNIRVREAVDYFDKHVKSYSVISTGFSFEELVDRVPHFHETMMIYGMLAAAGTGVQGVAPKYLLTEALNGQWYADAALQDDKARKHFIVKRPRGDKESDRKILRNEACYMEVARKIGLRVYEVPRIHGDMLFIPRFDREVRDNEVLRFHQESVASLAGLAGFGVQANQFELLAAIRSVVDDPLQETVEFVKRDVLNLAMKNTDNHARNTAVQIVHGVTQLTPLFDFAPMYLDSEGITRASRWFHPETKIELKSWMEILPFLELSSYEVTEFVRTMVAFGEELKSLSMFMSDAGVDADIIDFLRPSIDVQVAQLLKLRVI